MEAENICIETIDAVKLAGKYILEEGGKNKSIEEKGQHNFVTKVDRGAEKILVKELMSIFPEAGFITEEGTRQDKKDLYNWVIDPIDGTTNFIHGAFPFAVSVGLIKNNVPVLGVILELGLNECFYAWENGGAYLNGKKIKVSDTATLNDSLIATGFPYTHSKYLEGFMKSMEWFMRHSRGFRRLGSAATDIAWVACGRYDGFYEYGLSPWDIAAGTIILKEAGGHTTDFRGSDNYLFGEEIICSNSRNHEELLNVIKTTITG